MSGKTARLVRLERLAVAIGVSMASLHVDGSASDPGAWGSAARTAQQRWRSCAFAAAGASAARGVLTQEAAARAAAAAVAGCTAERTELRTMLLFEYRLHADAAQRADRGVTAATARLIDALTAHLQHER